MEKNHVYLPGDILKRDDASNNSQSEDCLATSACISLELPIFPYHTTTLGPGSLYVPSSGDIVVGLIIKVSGDEYKVDIQSSFDATLPTTWFNHATKQNRPFLEIGNLVIARVVSVFNENSCFSLATADTEQKGVFQSGSHTPAVLSCVDINDSKSWSTGEVYFGKIARDKEGYFFKIPLPFALSLQADDCYVLDRLGAFFKYQIAVGINGRVWVLGETPRCTLLIAQVLQKSCGLCLPEIENLILNANMTFKNE